MSGGESVDRLRQAAADPGCMLCGRFASAHVEGGEPMRVGCDLTYDGVVLHDATLRDHLRPDPPPVTAGREQDALADLLRNGHLNTPGGLDRAAVLNLIDTLWPAPADPPAGREQDARETLTDVLVAHQRKDTGSCLCGWSELGLSHARHQADAVLAALDLLPSPPATTGAGEER